MGRLNWTRTVYFPHNARGTAPRRAPSPQPAERLAHLARLPCGVFDWKDVAATVAAGLVSLVLLLVLHRLLPDELKGP